MKTIMENYTKEFYLENRKKTRYDKQVFFFGPDAAYQFKDLIQKLNELEKEFEGKEEVKLWIDASGYEDFGECYLMVGWRDWETEEEFEKRMWDKKWAKERAVESLKHLIDRNPQEAVEYIKELNLI
jgi:hypothetical protein